MHATSTASKRKQQPNYTIISSATSRCSVLATSCSRDGFAAFEAWPRRASQAPLDDARCRSNKAPRTNETFRSTPCSPSTTNSVTKLSASYLLGLNRVLPSPHSIQHAFTAVPRSSCYCLQSIFESGKTYLPCRLSCDAADDGVGGNEGICANGTKSESSDGRLHIFTSFSEWSSKIEVELARPRLLAMIHTMEQG